MPREHNSDYIPIRPEVIARMETEARALREEDARLDTMALQ